MKLLNNLSFEKLKLGLTKSRDKIFSKLSETFSGKANINESTLEEIEEVLISCDIGINAAENIITKARQVLLKNSNRSLENFVKLLKDELLKIFLENNVYRNDFVIKQKPHIILIAGINGSGKTTTIGKLAYYFKKNKYNVLVSSADTFRAAANDQLKIWAERAGVEIISGNTNDPGSIVYDTLIKAHKSDIDIVLIDTAGRLHTQKNLMDELSKIKSVINKFNDAPTDTFLVIDGNSGQNALQQVIEFEKFAKIDGLIITKLDGTTKGGAIFNICSDKKIPVRFIGIGEEIDDLQVFNPNFFVDAILDNQTNGN